MKKVLAFLLIGIFALGTIVFASTEIEKITFDLANQIESIDTQTGDLELFNSVATNGDTIEKSHFVPDGGYYPIKVGQPRFAQDLITLIQRNAVNVDTITSVANNQTGDYIAQEDSTVVQDFGNVSK